jgi:hypothetical protein
MLAATILGAAAITVLTGGQAQAHASCVHHGNDFGCSNSDHNRWSACDYERDGHRVYAEIHIGGEDFAVFRVVDANGADAGCGVRYEPGIRFRQLRVCEDVPGTPDSCTTWRNI